jgi:preprotein translocase subunit YajC
MKIAPETRQRIVKNAFLSLFIFILPIALMFITFYFTGERPWEKKHAGAKKELSENKIKLNNDGSND